MRSPAPSLRQRFSSPAVSRTATPSHSRSNSFADLEALEEGHVGSVTDDPSHYDLSIDTTTTISTPSLMLPIQRPSRVFVPDKDYKDYLYSGYYRGSSSSSASTIPCCDRVTCAKCCSIFSLVAILFLLFVGILIDTQPLYLKGLRPKIYKNGQTNNGEYNNNNNNSANVAMYGGINSQRLPAASNAYAAAVAYFITLMISTSALSNGTNIVAFVQSSWRRRQYNPIGDNDSTIPVFHLSESPTTPSRRLWDKSVRRFKELFKPSPKTKRG